MSQKCFFVALFVLYLALNSAAGTEVTTVESIVVLPGSDGGVQTSILLPCSIDPAPALPFAPLRWILPSGVTLDIFTLDDRFAVIAGPNFEAGNPPSLAFSLLIKQLSYTDAGTYVCEFDENGETLSVSVDLVLEVDLQVVANVTNFTVLDEVPETSLSCEMSLYLHPDVDLQWFRDGELINTTEMERHTVSFNVGIREGQSGGQVVQQSRVSTLVISEPQLSDSATYACAIRNTEHSQDIQLTVVTNFTDNVTVVNPPPPTATIEVREVGSPFNPPGTFSSSRSLGCRVTPPSPTIEVEWILPDNTVISSSNGRFRVLTFPQSTEHSVLLNIMRVSYADEGKYKCQFRDNSSHANSEWLSNSTELLLPVFLEVHPMNQSNVFVRDNVTEVAISCEMSLYLRPDEDMQWFREGQLINTNTERHTITSTNGSKLGQFRETEVGPSRISTLVISEPQLSDSANYTCAIRNTEHSQDIQLTVESADESSEEAATASDLALLVIYTSSGAALVILVALMIVVVFCIATMYRIHRRENESPKQSTVDDHLYDIIPGDQSHSTTITIDANPAYSSHRGEHKGDEESNLDALKVLTKGQEAHATTTGPQIHNI